MSDAYWLHRGSPAATAKPIYPPVDPTGLRLDHSIGCTIASIILKRTYDIREVARIYADCGVTSTTVNLALSAEWPSMRGDAHIRPFKTVPDGSQWDLYDWNPEHLDRVDACAYEMNSRGILVQWCYEELYRWSIRKKHPETPDARTGPYALAANVNLIDYVGPHYGDPGGPKSEAAKEWDSDMLAHVIPDQWSRDLLTRLEPHLGLDYNIFLVGNEYPEKSLHERMRNHVRAVHPFALVSVNRNEDTPGQYANMKIGVNYDYLIYHGHGMCTVEDLDRHWPESQSSVPTMRTLLEDPDVDTQRIQFSSDGARISDDPVNTYDYDALGEFALEVVCEYGCSFEHQSRAKMTDHPNLHMIETDFLTQLATAAAKA